MAEDRKSAPRLKKRAARAKPGPKAKRKRPRPRGKLQPTGRPHECKPEVIERVVQAISVGATMKDAAAFAGKSESCLQKWFDRARHALKDAGIDWDGELPENAHLQVARGEEPFVRLFVEVTRARAQGRVGLLATIAKCAKGGAVWETNDKGERVQVGFIQPDWRAGAKLLAIRDPESYAEKTRVELGGKDGTAPTLHLYMPEERKED